MSSGQDCVVCGHYLGDALDLDPRAGSQAVADVDTYISNNVHLLQYGVESVEVENVATSVECCGVLYDVTVSGTVDLFVKENNKFTIEESQLDVVVGDGPAAAISGLEYQEFVLAEWIEEAEQQQQQERERLDKEELAERVAVFEELEGKWQDVMPDREHVEEMRDNLADVASADQEEDKQREEAELAAEMALQEEDKQREEEERDERMAALRRFAGDFLNSPNDAATPIRNAICGAIEVASSLISVYMYSFNDKEIAGSLIAAKDRGCDVRVVVDKSQYDKQPTMKPTVDSLAKAGIQVQLATGCTGGSYPGAFHVKELFIDGVLRGTGSYNFTNAGSHKNYETWTMSVGDPRAFAAALEEQVNAAGPSTL